MVKVKKSQRSKSTESQSQLVKVNWSKSTGQSQIWIWWNLKMVNFDCLCHNLVIFDWWCHRVWWNSIVLVVDIRLEFDLWRYADFRLQVGESRLLIFDYSLLNFDGWFSIPMLLNFDGWFSIPEIRSPDFRLLIFDFWFSIEVEIRLVKFD